jgi:hypothetical protein
MRVVTASTSRTSRHRHKHCHRGNTSLQTPAPLAHRTSPHTRTPAPRHTPTFSCLHSLRLAHVVSSCACSGRRSNEWVWPPVLVELKRKAKKQGLWNMFLPVDSAAAAGVHGGGLGGGFTNRQYAELCEILGTSCHMEFASQCTNCTSPDTGNMEVRESTFNPKSPLHPTTLFPQRAFARFGQLFACLNQMFSCLCQLFACLNQMFSCLCQLFACLNQMFACLCQLFACRNQMFECLCQLFACLNQMFECLCQLFACLNQMFECLCQLFSCLGQMFECLCQLFACLGQMFACLCQLFACLGPTVCMACLDTALATRGHG